MKVMERGNILSMCNRTFVRLVLLIQTFIFCLDPGIVKGAVVTMEIKTQVKTPIPNKPNKLRELTFQQHLENCLNLSIFYKITDPPLLPQQRRNILVTLFLDYHCRQYVSSLSCINNLMTNCSTRETTLAVQEKLGESWALNANYLCKINQENPEMRKFSLEMEKYSNSDDKEDKTNLGIQMTASIPINYTSVTFRTDVETDKSTEVISYNKRKSNQTRKSTEQATNHDRVIERTANPFDDISNLATENFTLSKKILRDNSLNYHRQKLSNKSGKSAANHAYYTLEIAENVKQASLSVEMVQSTSQYDDNTAQ